MVSELLEQGFSSVELGHGIRVSLLPGIREAISAGCSISSVHNFCPLPVEITHASPDCFQFTSHREADRTRSLKLTYRTIDLAHELGAQFVVLHLGSVPLRGAMKALEAEAMKSGTTSRAYIRKKIDLIRKREAIAPLYFERALSALRHLAEYAGSRNIHLGIESRQSFEQVPTETELLEILDALNSPFVGYWHDFGHVQIREHLGLVNHAQWLHDVRHRLLGCHLHDVVWPMRDHQAPFRGRIDYDALIPQLPKDALLVWEMGPGRKAEEIQESVKKWKARYA